MKKIQNLIDIFQGKGLNMITTKLSIVKRKL